MDKWIGCGGWKLLSPGHTGNITPAIAHNIRTACLVKPIGHLNDALFYIFLDVELVNRLTLARNVQIYSFEINLSINRRSRVLD